MTDETRRLIEEIAALYEKATKGPFYRSGEYVHQDGDGLAMMKRVAKCYGESKTEAMDNAELFVALVNAWPRLKELRSEGREGYVVVNRDLLDRVRKQILFADYTLSGFDKRRTATELANEIGNLLAAPPAPNRDAEDARRYRWLREHVTFHDIDADYDVEGKNVPVLAQVSNRVWYHATDDTQNNTLDTVIDAALAAAPEVTR